MLTFKSSTEHGDDPDPKSPCWWKQGKQPRTCNFESNTWRVLGLIVANWMLPLENGDQMSEHLHLPPVNLTISVWEREICTSIISKALKPAILLSNQMTCCHDSEGLSRELPANFMYFIPQTEHDAKHFSRQTL